MKRIEEFIAYRGDKCWVRAFIVVQPVYRECKILDDGMQILAESSCLRRVKLSAQNLQCSLLESIVLKSAAEKVSQHVESLSQVLLSKGRGRPIAHVLTHSIASS